MFSAAWRLAGGGFGDCFVNDSEFLIFIYAKSDVDSRAVLCYDYARAADAGRLSCADTATINGENSC